jgi:uncharacterized lipoprotein YddW (UPF0748 family)
LRGWLLSPLLALLAVATVVAGCDGRKAESSDPPCEVRGVWISDVDSDILFSRQAISAGMERLVDAGFTVVFPVVWNNEYTLYPRGLMESRFGAPYRQDPVSVSAPAIAQSAMSPASVSFL